MPVVSNIYESRKAGMALEMQTKDISLQKYDKKLDN
jgi:hypothetical protein